MTTVNTNLNNIVSAIKAIVADYPTARNVCFFEDMMFNVCISTDVAYDGMPSPFTIIFDQDGVQLDDDSIQELAERIHEYVRTAIDDEAFEQVDELEITFSYEEEEGMLDEYDSVMFAR